MLGGAIGLFGLHFLLTAWDSIAFHPKRQMEPARRRVYAWQSLIFLAMLGFILAFPMTRPFSKPVFGVLALIWLALWVNDERVHVGRFSSSEQVVHSVLFMLHPLVLIFAMVFWNFIHGVSFFLNAVLPFKTTGFKPVLIGYAALTAFLFVYQLLQARSKAGAPAETQASPAQAKTQPETVSV